MYVNMHANINISNTCIIKCRIHIHFIYRMWNIYTFLLHYFTLHYIITLFFCYIQNLYIKIYSINVCVYIHSNINDNNANGANVNKEHGLKNTQSSCYCTSNFSLSLHIKL